MKQLVTTLWILIIAGALFISYSFLIAPNIDNDDKQPETPSTQQPQTPAEKNENYSTLIRTGDDYFENDFFTEALAEYKKALTRTPESKEALFKVATTYLKDNKPERAREFLLQLRESHPSTEIDVLIGRSYLNQRDVEQAKTHFESLDYKDGNVKFYRGIIDILYKKYDAAKESLNGTEDIRAKILLQAFAITESTSEPQTSYTDTLFAKAFIDAEEYEAAIPLLFNAINSQNDYRDSWVLLGYAYLKTGKYDDALDSFLQAKTLDPEKPETLFFLGITYAVQDKLDDAIFYLEKAKIAGFEPEVQVRQKLGDIHLLQEEYDKAVKEYEKVTLLNPSDITIFTKAVWASIEKLDKPHRALGFGERAVIEHPDEAMSYNLRGWSYVAMGDYDKAKADLTRALELDPNLPSAYLNIGWMFEKQGELKIAKEYYKKAYNLDDSGSISSIAVVRFNQITKKVINSHFQADITSH